MAENEGYYLLLTAFTKSQVTHTHTHTKYQLLYVYRIFSEADIINDW